MPATAASSRSGMRSSSRRAAARSRPGHGSGSPSPARAATARAPAATWARWTGVAAGSEARSAGPRLGVHAVGQPQAPQRVGPQAQEPAPVRPARGERAAPPVRAVHRPHDGGHARRLLERGHERRAIRASDAALAACRRSRRPGAAAAAVTSAASRVAAASRSATRSATTDRSAPRPSWVRADTASTGTPGSPSRSSSAPRSARQDVAVRRLEAVRLVEHDEHRLAVAGQRPQVVLVQRGVGVLLRVDDPHHEIGERDHAVHLEAVLAHDGVEVGQVEQDEPVQLVPHAVAARHLEPVEQRVVDAAPDRRARGRRRGPPVAGRGELGAGERVEQRRLPRAGRAGEGDHGALDAEPEALAGAPHDRLGGRHGRAVEPAAGELGRLGERRQAAVERALGRPPALAAARDARRQPAHRAASTARSASRSAMRWSGDGASGSSSAR